MPSCEESLAWVRLSRAPGLIAASLHAALERCGSAQGLIAAGDAELDRAGISAAARAYLRDPATLPNAAERRWLEHPGHHVVPLSAPDYPSLLRRLADRPTALYVSGKLEALGEPQLALVGSRSPTPQGLDNAFEFARRLCERGLAITSGLARGIDGAGHRGALAAQGLTLAVLGGGVDVVYPLEHRELGGAIEQYGALLSRFPLGTLPRRTHFPERNRVMAGMTLGTLVVEAAAGSGSLITARAAEERGRPVFAIPGSIHNPLSRGCHQLIKRGAKLAEKPDDILSGLSFSAFFARPDPPAEPRPAPAVRASGMDKDRKILLDALGFDPTDLDTLVVRTGLKPEAVSSMMLILELEGHVQAAPGGRYSRVANRRAGGER